jgi:ribonucleoside-triphosphate reductase
LANLQTLTSLKRCNIYVTEYFSLKADYLDQLAQLRPDFGYDGFGEIVFFRTYSRIKDKPGITNWLKNLLNTAPDTVQESWFDVVVRVINGTLSIRKDWYKKASIEWDEAYWQDYALRMAVSMFKMYWLPAGRGMWAMGTQFVYERGSMALNNCGATKLGGNDRLSDDLHWLMDALMLGVGVGFEPIRDDLKIYEPVGRFLHYIGDSREGWCDAVKMRVDAFTKPNHRNPIFKDDYVRGPGQPIKGFGGFSSGPAPLMQLLENIEKLFRTPGIDVVRLKADIANMIGCCVVAGNVRRSAELMKIKIGDKVALNLKDYDIYPERENYGYMSNNSAALDTDEEFEALDEIARRVVVRGEPGIINIRNLKYGRIGKKVQMREDKADLFNPCGEIPLEDKELCNVVETLPTRCPHTEDWYDACEFAATYAQSVSLLPTHRSETNRIVVHNRRIGVGIIDWTGWVYERGLHKVTAFMRKGYARVVETATKRAEETGVPAPIRFTTIKPGGTGPKLPGKTSGVGYPTFRWTLRRMRVAANNPICPILDTAGVPFEPCYFDPLKTRVYEYPTLQGPAQPAEEVSLWEQANNLVTVQREWSDNAVSNTLYFRPKWKLVLMRATIIRDFSLPKETQDQLRESQFTTDFANFASSELPDHYIQPPVGLFDKPKVLNIVVENHFKLQTKQNKYGEWELYIYRFDPNHEENIILKVLSSIAPLIKSCSVLPHTAKGAYRQMPEEGITEEEYKARLAKIKKIDWSPFCGSDGEQELYCSAESCQVILK